MRKGHQEGYAAQAPLEVQVPVPITPSTCTHWFSQPVCSRVLYQWTPITVIVSFRSLRGGEGRAPKAGMGWHGV